MDIRNHGSGNSGATNTMRVLGYKAAIPVLLVDMLKGFLAVKLYLLVPTGSEQQIIHTELLFGLFAVIGHIFPVFAGFRGGKGVATTSGVIFGINPLVFLICLGIFLLFVLITRMVSLGSILGAMSLPLLFILYLYPKDPYFFIFALLIFLIVVYKHFANIKRIFAGTENKLTLKRNR